MDLVLWRHIDEKAIRATFYVWGTFIILFSYFILERIVLFVLAFHSLDSLYLHLDLSI